MVKEFYSIARLSPLSLNWEETETNGGMEKEKPKKLKNKIATLENEEHNDKR